jgi:hypothetical protein
MRKTAIAVLALLAIQSLAQGTPNAGQCDQVRAAIAQHGLQAARKHAAEHHGLRRADVRSIEQSCGIDAGAERTNKKASGKRAN